MLRKVLHWWRLVHSKQTHLVNKLESNHWMNKQFKVKASNPVNQKHKHDNVKKHSQKYRPPNLLHLDIKVHFHIPGSIVKNRIVFNNFYCKPVISVINSICPNLIKFIRTEFLEINILSKKQTIEISINSCKTIVSCCWFLFKLQFPIFILINSTYIIYSDHEFLSCMFISNPMKSVRSHTFSSRVNEWVKENFSVCSVNPSDNPVHLHIVDHQEGIVHLVNFKSIKVFLSAFVLFSFIRPWISQGVLKSTCVVSHLLVSSIDE